MSRMSRALAAAAAALAVLVLLPGPAHAEKWSGDDATGDARAWQATDPDDWCAEPVEVASDDTPGEDITSLTVRHQPRKVVLRLRFAGPATTTDRSFTFDVRTARDTMSVDAYQRREGGRYTIDVFGETNWSEVPVDVDGDGVTDCTVWGGLSMGGPCRGATIDLEDQAVTVGVPRACLRFPRWVEVGASVWAHTDGDVDINDEWGVDEPSADPTVITYGERVRVSHGHSGSPSNRSRRASSATDTRRSFVISRTGLPIGTTAATAY